MAKQELMKQHFRETLMRMCETHRIDEITASDLIKEAGVARQSFYNHFADIDDAICYTASAPLVSNGAPLFSPEATRLAWDYATRHPGFFGQLHLHKGIHAYFETLVSWLVEKGCELLVGPELSQEERDYRTTQIVYHCAGCVDAYRRWAAEGMRVPVDVAARALHENTPAFIKEASKQLSYTFADYPR